MLSDSNILFENIDNNFVPFLLGDTSLMPRLVSPDGSNSERTPIQTTYTACQLMSLASLLLPKNVNTSLLKHNTACADIFKGQILLEAC